MFFHQMERPLLWGGSLATVAIISGWLLKVEWLKTVGWIIAVPLLLYYQLVFFVLVVTLTLEWFQRVRGGGRKQ